MLVVLDLCADPFADAEAAAGGGASDDWDGEDGKDAPFALRDVEEEGA